MDPPSGHKTCKQIYSSMGSSLHGATGPSRSLLQHGLFTGSQPALGNHLLQCGVLHGLQVEICSTVDHHGLQWNALPPHGLHHRLQGNLCPGAWSTSCPSFCTDLGVFRVLTPISYWKMPLCRVVFFFFVNMLSQKWCHHR